MQITPKMLLFGLAALILSSSKKGKGQSPGPSLRVPKDGARFTLEDLRSFAAQLGFADPNLAAAVAMAESGGFAAAIGDQGKSFGLWQINTPSHPQYDAQSLLDPTYNGTAALAISQGGTDWKPWTTFRTGAFQRYMPPATPAIAGAAAAAQLIEAVEPETPAPAAESEPQVPLEVEVLDQVEDVEPADANGVDARVRVSDASPPRRERGRRARRG